LRKQFAEAADDFVNYVTGVKTDLLQEAPGSFEEQLEALNSKEQALDNDNRVSDLQVIYKTLEEHGLEAENPYTDYTIEELTLLLDQVKSLFQKKRQFLENQLGTAGKSNITQDQINEFKETFKHFDKDHSGSLDKLEFRACLQSLGLTYTDEAFNALWQQLAKGGDKIDFDTFVEYMIKLLQDTDDANQIKESFKILANDRPNISGSDFHCPPLVQDDISYLTSRMPGKTDTYDYNTYTDNCFA